MTSVSNDLVLGVCQIVIFFMSDCPPYMNLVQWIYMYIGCCILATCTNTELVYRRKDFFPESIKLSHVECQSRPWVVLKRGFGMISEKKLQLNVQTLNSSPPPPRTGMELETARDSCKLLLLCLLSRFVLGNLIWRLPCENHYGGSPMFTKSLA